MYSQGGRMTQYSYNKNKNTSKVIPWILLWVVRDCIMIIKITVPERQYIWSIKVSENNCDRSNRRNRKV